MIGLKIFHKCNHILDGVQYEEASCPKCYGMGYYKDIELKASGQMDTVTGKELTKQEVLYLLSMFRGANPLYPNYGVSYTADDTEFRMSLESALSRLKGEQISLGRVGDELLDRWEIEIEKLSGIHRRVNLLLYLASSQEIGVGAFI